jgi:hypothetical protein
VFGYKEDRRAVYAFDSDKNAFIINTIEQIQKIVRLVQNSAVYNERILVVNLYELVDNQQLLIGNV